MKSIAVVFSLTIIVGVSCQNRQYEGKRFNSGSYGPPREGNYGSRNDNRNNFEGHGQKDKTNNQQEEPSKIPTLMGPFKSVGLLNALEQDVSDNCFSAPMCDSSAQFRTINGVCNNLQFPVWGQSHTSVVRIIQAHYSDGVSRPRTAKSGKELPNARHVRTTVFKNVDKTSPKRNLLVMQFGQLVAHDTVLLKPKTSNADGSRLTCCNPDGSTPKNVPKECLQIKIPANDPFPKKRCLSVPRVADTADKDCMITPVRQQLGVTSFLDASMLYGSDDQTAKSLRSFVDGKLKKQLGPYGKTFLPNVAKATQVCNVAKDDAVCYVAGDNRVNQNPHLAVATISFLRLHNYLCDELMVINPQWDDERLYQEAKRLLTAMYQHVTYNEFVPTLLGRQFSKDNKLLPFTEGYYDNGYDVNLNPTTFASFTAAAYRALHSTIQGFLNMYNEARKVTERIRLRDTFQRIEIVQNKNNYDSFYRGLLTQSSQEQDQYVTEEVTEFLNKKPNQTDGFDLITLDVERGRDYGIPAYNKFRQLCGLAKANTFNELSDQISKKNINLLASLYEDVDDIDFYVAGILEKPKPGSLFGHTLQCINGEMFYRWKFGDRFFYEFGDQPGSFTLNQLQEIRKTTMALIVCLTSDIQYVQRNAFDVPSHQNQLVPCKNITKLNLHHWTEEH